MQRIRAFFYVSFGVLALAGAFHFGAQNAQGQAPGNPVVSIETWGSPNWLAVAANGDTYRSADNGGSWALIGNVFGSPVQASQTSWGRIKADRR